MESVGKGEEKDLGMDRAGAWASGVCAVHCAICVLAPTVFTSLGVGMFLSHEAEWVLTVMAIAFGCGALSLGWRAHRSSAVLLLIVLGMAGLVVSRGLEMGSDHHPHHGQQHGEGKRLDEHANKDPHGGAEDKHQDEHEEQDPTHLAGAALGVLGGLLLASGHVLNMRAIRRTRESCREPCLDGAA